MSIRRSGFRRHWLNCPSSTEPPECSTRVGWDGLFLTAFSGFGAQRDSRSLFLLSKTPEGFASQLGGPGQQGQWALPWPFGPTPPRTDDSTARRDSGCDDPQVGGSGGSNSPGESLPLHCLSLGATLSWPNRSGACTQRSFFGPAKATSRLHPAAARRWGIETVSIW